MEPPAIRPKIGPKGEVLTSGQVSDLHESIIRRWSPTTEIWSLIYGNKLLSVVGAASGFHLNYLFRKRLRLPGFGLMSTLIPSVLIPLKIVHSVHQQIQENMYQSPFQCIICLEMRSTLRHLLGSVVIPMVGLLPLAILSESDIMVYRIPSFRRNPREFLLMYKKLYKPFKTQLTINIGLQVLVNMWIIHQKNNQMALVQQSFTLSPVR